MLGRLQPAAWCSRQQVPCAAPTSAMHAQRSKPDCAGRHACARSSAAPAPAARTFPAVQLTAATCVWQVPWAHVCINARRAGSTGGWAAPTKPTCIRQLRRHRQVIRHPLGLDSCRRVPQQLERGADERGHIAPRRQHGKRVHERRRLFDGVARKQVGPYIRHGALPLPLLLPMKEGDCWRCWLMMNAAEPGAGLYTLLIAAAPPRSLPTWGCCRACHLVRASAARKALNQHALSCWNSRSHTPFSTCIQ